MRKIIKKQRKEEKGITLIALVITIIVLLILAAVSIATLTGENGILIRANEAKTETEEAKGDELRRLTALEAATNLEDTIYTDNSTGEEKTVTIPAETAISQVEGENTLKGGLVIIDKNGNEWVWIEVPENIMPENLTFENAEDYRTLETALQQYTATYRDTEFTDEWYDGCGLKQEEYTILKQNMLKSIYENEGFFVGRYEVGSFDNPVTSNDTTRTAVIQKYAYPYNYVTCSQAEKLSEKLAIGGKTSSLMLGLQWDLILKYIEMNWDWDTSNHEASYYLKEDSSSWGNYSDAEFSVPKRNKYAVYSNSILGDWKEIQANYIKSSDDTKNNKVLLTTGATNRNSKMNIYDLAGNMFECTIEKSNNDIAPASRRGGVYGHDGIAASRRDNLVVNTANDGIGFRPVLTL